MIRPFFIVLMIALAGAVTAQTNLALSATASASASSSGNYGPSNWNDGLTGPSYYFGWVGTDPSSFPPAWIQYEWSSPVTCNRLVFWPPDWSSPGFVYFYGGATVQYWDGSAWVNHQNFLSLNPTMIDTVEFPTVTTSRLRVANFNVTGQHNPGWDEIEVLYEVPPQSDLEVTGILSPPDTLWTSATYAVVMRVRNNGPDPVTAFQLGYEVGGQSDEDPWTGFLPAGDSTVYNFVSTIDPTLLLNPVTLGKFYVHAPDDSIRSNDTLYRQMYRMTVGLGMDAGIRTGVFPNPAADRALLFLDGPVAARSLRIYSMHGLVREGSVLAGEGSPASIDLGDLPPGLYLVVVDGMTFRLVTGP